jgi:hypothetical protein
LSGSSQWGANAFLHWCQEKTSKTVTPLLDGSVTMENAATKRCFEWCFRLPRSLSVRWASLTLEVVIGIDADNVFRIKGKWDTWQEKMIHLYWSHKVSSTYIYMGEGAPRRDMSVRTCNRPRPHTLELLSPFIYARPIFAWLKDQGKNSHHYFFMGKN